VTQLFAALIGLLVGAAAAWIKAILAIREKVNEELRTRRLAAYPIVWRETAALSNWPPAALTRKDLLELNLSLRVWYFTKGGLYLSENSRTRYGELKELICARLDYWDDGDDEATTLAETKYLDLAKTCSAFRTSLTEDLETRRQRSLWWAFKRWQLHRRQKAEWDERRSKLPGKGDQARLYPLSELELPPIESDATPATHV
jgi:hypothetical protein